jgi:hypothetical protein
VFGSTPAPVDSARLGTHHTTTHPPVHVVGSRREFRAAGGRGEDRHAGGPGTRVASRLASCLYAVAIDVINQIPIPGSVCAVQVDRSAVVVDPDSDDRARVGQAVGSPNADRVADLELVGGVCHVII